MPQNLTQIALEHHRAGRVQQAHAGYRSALEADPADPDALHWLGVLMFQAGRADAALPLLEQAAQARPKDPAFQHNLGQAYLHCRRADDAIRTFERASTLDSNQPQTLFGLAMAHLARNSQEGVRSALFFLKQANLAGLDSAEFHLHRGNALLMADRIDDAIEAFGAALGRKADLVAPHYQLAAAYRKKGNLTQTRHWLAATLQLEPEHPHAWLALAVLEAEAGHFTEAEALLRGVIAIKPAFAPAYANLAEVLKARGRAEEAEAVLEEGQRASAAPAAAAPDSSEALAALDARLTPTEEGEQGHFALAVKSNFAPPPRIPEQSVVDLFDKYADRFDEHLRGKLEYHVPEMIGSAATALHAGRPLDVLDLGSGTGMCGVHLRPLAGLLWGIDLAPLMIAKAQSRGIYDRLELGEIVRVMRTFTQPFDLIVSGDVMIYIGDLTPVYEQIARLLRPGGRMISSFESAPGDRYTMNQKTLRYSHSQAYLRRLADIFGLAEEACADITVRKESAKPVPGWLLTLRKPL